ncbi:MAG TPA: hypothetical protein PKC67_03320 [Kiritimatiellia bacterium]|nr:hypothetical protein [Kiritimatiellia bacterium]HMP33357.1 hypothetical protein [Kiritimatiellia bacterium]
MKPIDLLLLAPLEEEAWACKRWFHATEKSLPLGVEWMQHDNGLSIGLYYFNGMGSVAAAISSSPVIERYRPKAVMLVGIAAGIKGKYELGCVGFNDHIYYCSYGKIKGDGNPELRALSYPQDALLGTTAHNVKSNDWAQIAKEWYDKERITWSEVYRCREQEWPDYNLFAMSSDVASGELVIASDTHQKYLQGEYPRAKLYLFEMEAYAVASACDKYKIPFLTVRGVSDDGTTSKDGDKKDAHRLCATLVASSYVKAMVESPGLVDYIKQLNQNPIRATVPCMLPKVFTPCPSKYKCVDVGIHVDSAQRAHLTGAFENVTFNDYSTSLGKRLNQMKGLEKVAFLFPYSPKDLLRIIGKNSEARELVDNVWQSISSASSGNVISNLKQIAEIGRRQFWHFAACEEACKRLQDGPLVNDKGLLPIYLSRIVVVSGERRLEDDILSLLYTYFLGEVVPTFWIHESDLATEVIDDITFFEEPDQHLLQVNPDFNWLRAVRFFHKSRLLVATGWPCDASGLKQKGQKKLTHISGLYRRWQDEIIAHLSKGDPLKKFHKMPHHKLRRFETMTQQSAIE